MKTSHYVMDGSYILNCAKHRQFGSKLLWDRFWVIFAGPVMNFLFAIVIFIHSGLLQGTPTNQVKEVVEGSPAEQAGMINGDAMTEINGTEITGWNKMTSIIQENANNQLGLNVDREERMFLHPLLQKNNSFQKTNRLGRIGVAHEYQVNFLEIPSVFGFTSTYEFGKPTS